MGLWRSCLVVGVVGEDVFAEAFGAGFGSNVAESGGGRDLWCKRAGRVGALVERIC